ncbi:hypothetical protein MPSYJ_47170 [Mycolicibacterium psychrotolerans]|uniref:Uncharacterized protein n=1 Tax=Mycolicibacterium psychrotolerans TaxID=216929 RepID=A0A7I7MGN2_9MYCO|nr:hypothetical protein MPSYJ_47170 [Mycolicibacterium psychrotolerans]
MLIASIAVPARSAPEGYRSTGRHNEKRAAPRRPPKARASWPTRAGLDQHAGHPDGKSRTAISEITLQAAG